ncbi:hypothetical protein [Mycolicibacterium sp.]|jgi:hypothetical protein|uniref:hypothetical protein n=1 Tax=Mycolicibacterium sp. TaxID=2320850 RepID=UPI0028A98E4C|nr:hypothetical protein [Mycolicibacterium sp.]
MSHALSVRQLCAVPLAAAGIAAALGLGAGVAAAAPTPAPCGDVTHCVSPNPPSIDLQPAAPSTGIGSVLSSQSSLAAQAARQDLIEQAKESVAALKLTQLPKTPDFVKQQSTLFKNFSSVLSAIKAAQAGTFKGLARS